MIFFLIPLIAAITIVCFIVVVRGLQRRFGDVFQNKTFAYAALGVAIFLDALVVVFSVAVCSYAMREGLDMTANALRSAGVVRALVGDITESGGVKIGDIWGFIIPILSWLTAHGIILGIIVPLRETSVLITERVALRQRASALHAQAVARRLTSRLSRIAGAVLLGAGSFVVFKDVIQFDKLLFTYQVINQTILKNLLGGKTWASQYSIEEARNVLEGTFLGQMALHAGDIYVIGLFVMAFFTVVMLHRALTAGENSMVTPPIPGNASVTILIGGTPPRYPNNPRTGPEPMVEPVSPPPPVEPVNEPPGRDDDPVLIFEEPR